MEMALLIAFFLLFLAGVMFGMGIMATMTSGKTQDLYDDNYNLQNRCNSLTEYNQILIDALDNSGKTIATEEGMRIVGIDLANKIDIKI